MRSNFHRVQNRVLRYLETLKVRDHHFAFTRGGESNIYSSILGLFILDLFDAVNASLSLVQRESLAEYIQSHQNEETGIFEPTGVTNLNRPLRNQLQLTTFAISALDILNSEPLFGLPFEKELEDPGFIDEFFELHGVLKGNRGSGNMAMFIGIFLCILIEKNDVHTESMNRWFLLLDQNSNKHGFWGSGEEKLYFNGVQNGFHQYVIYNFLGKKIPKAEMMLTALEQCEDRFGHFAPFPGGAACEDYDALFLYLMLSKQLGLESANSSISLDRIESAIIASQNDDGGFCQSNYGKMKLIYMFLRTLVYKESIELKLIKIRKGLGYLLRYSNGIKVNWFNSSRGVNESNLWDTWFKCLMLAELDRVRGYTEFKFQRVVGLGNAVR